MKKIRLQAVPMPALPDRELRMQSLEVLCREKISELIQAPLLREHR